MIRARSVRRRGLAVLGALVGSLVLSSPALAADTMQVTQASAAATDTGPSHVTITATWTIDPGRSSDAAVGVDVVSGTTCPASDATPTYPLATGAPGTSNPSPAPTVAFAPSNSGPYAVCGYVGGTLATDASPPSTAAFTAAWTLGPGILVSGNYTDDAPIDVTPQVTAYPSTGLWIYAHSGTGACGATAAADAARAGTIDAFLKPDQAHRVVTGPGIDAPTGRFTVTDPGIYTVCAYVADAQSDSPRASQSQQVTVSRATAGLLFTAPTATIATRPVSFAYDVTAQVPTGRSFFAYVHPFAAGDCGANPAAEAAVPGVITLAGSGGVPMPDVTPPTVSSIHRDLSFTPAAAGRYRVCAYVAAGTTGQVDGVSDPIIDVRSLAYPLAITASPATDVAAGTSVALHLTGSAETARTLFSYVHAGGADACAATAGAEAARALDGGQILFNPYTASGPVDATASVTMGADARGYRACAYWATSADATPDAIASATFLPTGAGTDLDVDPGPMPAKYGHRGKGGFYVNTSVLPAGVSADRFLTLARRAGREWGFTFRGTTMAGAAHRDGKRVVGFTKSMSPTRKAGLVNYTRRVRTCTRRHGHLVCRMTTRRVETDVALSRTLTSWNQGPVHPTSQQVDLETMLVRAFGMLAGNRADEDDCSGSPLLSPLVPMKGAWWRSATDHFQPTC